MTDTRGHEEVAMDATHYRRARRLDNVPEGCHRREGVAHALDADRKRVVVRLAGPPALTPEISVVIPTHDRLEALHRVVEALETQRDAPACELIIVDDGSSDGTAEWLQRYPFRLPTQVVSQGNRGPAAARNRGIDLAGGRLVAFLGDRKSVV